MDKILKESMQPLQVAPGVVIVDKSGQSMSSAFEPLTLQIISCG